MAGNAKLEPPSNDEAGVLVVLWRKILTEKKIIHHLDALVNQFIRKHGSPPSVKVHSKSALSSEASSNRMTIKVFLKLVFSLLGAKKIELGVRITYSDDSTSIHSIEIHPGSIENTTAEELLEMAKKESKQRNNNEGNRSYNTKT